MLTCREPHMSPASAVMNKINDAVYGSTTTSSSSSQQSKIAAKGQDIPRQVKAGAGVAIGGGGDWIGGGSGLSPFPELILLKMCIAKNCFSAISYSYWSAAQTQGCVDSPTHVAL